MRQNIYNKSLCMIEKKEFVDYVSFLCMNSKEITIDDKKVMYSYINKINEYQALKNVQIKEFAVQKDNPITKFLPPVDSVTLEKIQNALNYAIIYTLDKELIGLLSTIYRKVYINGTLEAERIISEYNRGEEILDYIRKNGTFNYVQRKNEALDTDKEIFVIDENLEITKRQVIELPEDNISVIKGRMLLLADL